MRPFRDLWANVYLRAVLLALMAYAAYRVLLWTEEAWTSLLVALLLAYLLDPVVRWFGGRRSRGVGLVAVVLIAIALLGMFWLLVLHVASQVTLFVNDVPHLLELAREMPYRIARAIDPNFGGLFQQVYVNLDGIARSVATAVTGRLAQPMPAGGFMQQAVAVMGGGARVAVIVVLSLYLLYAFPAYVGCFLEAVPERDRDGVATLLRKAARAVAGYVRAQVVIAAIVGLLTYTGLALVGVPLASALGLIAGVANLVPFLGPVLTTPPTLFLAFTQGTGTVVAAGLVLLAVNQLDGHLISPLIVSRAISLDPITVILAIVVGAALFGLPGAIIAVPTSAVLKILYTDYYRRSAWYRGDAPEEPGA